MRRQVIWKPRIGLSHGKYRIIKGKLQEDHKFLGARVEHSSGETIPVRPLLDFEETGRDQVEGIQSDADPLQSFLLGRGQEQPHEQPFELGR